MDWPREAGSRWMMLNMDAQDKQDKKDVTLRPGKRTGSMIECAFVENLSVLGGPSWIPLFPFVSDECRPCPAGQIIRE